VTPADRSRLIARAKGLAVPVASCVTADICPAHLLSGLSRDELRALVIVLADCASRDRLRIVTASPGDLGMPPHRDALRAAHAERRRLERAGLPVPFAVRAADGQYQADVRRRRIAAA
jgi:hypothetical protein